jgi:replicative DNA helicase
MIEEAIVRLTTYRHHNQIVDFRKARDTIVSDLKQKMLNVGDYGIRTGWEYLDNMTNGLVGGDLVSIIGRPAAGKTWLQLYLARHAWFNQTKACMFVSMEMNPLLIQQRLMSMQGSFALNDMKTGHLTSMVKNKLYKGFTEIEAHGKPFWIVDGNMTASIDDIRLLAMQLQPEFIVIDGAYLLKNPDTRLDRFARVAENTRLLKQSVAEDQKVPVFGSYQFNREAAKKAKSKSGPSTGLEDIAFSDEVGQVSSLVLALTQKESTATLTRKSVELLKGRNGEFGSWDINWDFNHMDFSQCKEQNVANEEEFSSI